MFSIIWKIRFKGYLEIFIVSAVWIIIVAALIWALYGWILPIEARTSVWAGVAILIPVFLLPYLVVSSRVWDVNLTIMGAKGERTNIRGGVDQPKEVIRGVDQPKEVIK